MKFMRMTEIIIGMMLLILIIPPVMAAEWYAAPDGLQTNPGTIEAPWDIESALMNYTKVKAGETIYLRGGIYYHPDRTPNNKGYAFYLLGASGAPITVRPYQNERVTIDGGLHTHGAPRHVIIRDLEIIVSENLTETRISNQAGSAPTDMNRPLGGFTLEAGTDIKIINCVVHANAGGFGFWQSVSGDSELYGNIIYDNGWIGPDRYHGPGIYGQNSSADWKYVRDNIIFDQYSFNMQLTGKTPEISRFHVEGNFFYKTKPFSSRDGVIIGSYASPLSYDGRVLDNVHYDSGLDVGHNGGIDNAIVTGNTIVKADLVFNGANLEAHDNFLWKVGWLSPKIINGTVDGATRNDGNIDDVAVPIPTSPMVFLKPNAYDANRAHLAIMNFQSATSVEVDASAFLNSGDSYRLMNPADFYGEPVLAGDYTGGTISVPVIGEFVAYILLKNGVEIPANQPPTSPLNAPLNLRIKGSK
jgi:hypothetical protein